MASTPGSTRIEKIIVAKQNGKKLVGVLHDTGSKDVIVLCHGYRSSKDQKTIVTICDAIEKENLSAFRFDFSGNGESEGDFQYSNYWGEVDDLRTFVLYFTKKGRNISAIIGHSKGADVVLLYASKYQDVPAVVNVSGRFKMNRGLEALFGVGYMKTLKKDGSIELQDSQNGKFKYRVTLQSVEDRLAINMEEYCFQIDKGCRVLTVHGSIDEVIPVEEASMFEEAIPNHTKHIIKGADHCYYSHLDELTSTILSFLKNV